MFQNLATTDLILILLYFILLLGIGFHYSRKEKNSTDYFLAGKNVGWIAIGASLFVTSISSEHFLGLAGTGATYGLVVGHFELMATFFVLLLSWVFVPFYIKSGVYTMPEFLERRYNKSSRMYLTTISIISYVFTKILVILYAGGLLLNEIMGLDMAVSAIIMITIAGMYSMTGGLKAIVHVDILQAMVFILGALILTFFGLRNIGGLSELQLKAPAHFFDMFRPSSDPVFPWTGIIFGVPILGIWYWCTDQYVVQRVLGGRDINHVRSGTILAGFLKILPVFILVLPGIIAYVQFSDASLGDRAFPALIAGGLLPTGIKGIVIASFLAALISSLASSFNSSATLFTMDFYRQFRPHSTEKELVLVGRLATVAIISLGILLIPFLRFISSHIFIFLLKVQAYISPPIAAVFIIGLLWKRANGTGAIWALGSGAVVSSFVLTFNFLCDGGYIYIPFLQPIAEINFLHFAVFLFLISSAVLVTVTLIVQSKSSDRMVLSTGFIDQPGIVQKIGDTELKWTKINVGFSALLILIVLMLYAIFF
ncbi:sodium/solute symporter [candidate division KSB1 bacterium]|nr:sodium/solute symporter [candidate division KSB1 bacterium]